MASAPYGTGVGASATFAAGCLVVAVWAGIAVHAYRRAARRRAVFGLGDGDGGAVELILLAPLIVAGATLLWAGGGPGTSSDAALADYVTLWQDRKAVDASARFVRPPSPAELERAWDRQLAVLTDELVRIAASNPDAGIDPTSPLVTVRFEAAGPGLVAVSVARRETVRELLLGLLPTSSQRLVPVARLGTIRLVSLKAPGPIDGGPPVERWQIDVVEVLGESIGG